MLSAVPFRYFLPFLSVSILSLFAISSVYAENIQVREGEYLISRNYETRSLSSSRPELVSLSADTLSTRSRSSSRSADFDQQRVDSDCAQIMASDPSISDCEPNVIWSISAVPNDKHYSQLYGMANIDAPEAWDISTGSSEVIVAVLDTGIDYTHTDLADNMWTNPGEIPGNGVDDDNNGFIDDIYGADFYNNDGDPFDDHGHGTHCAGTVGATGNNSVGVVGVNWQVKLMALKFLSAGGGGSTFDAVLAMDYAVAMGADVINASFGGRYASSQLEDAIDRAAAAGVLVVAASGNNGTNNDSLPHYPSGFSNDAIVSVGATDENDQITYFSNYGSTSVDLMAPGMNILSTLPGGYGNLSGTSMAAPHVAGLAALILSNNPSFTPVQLKNLMMNTVDVFAALSSKAASSGRINAAKALGGEGNPNNGGGGENTPSTPKILAFTGKGGSALKPNRSFVVKVRSGSSQDLPANLLLTGRGGTSLECSLGTLSLSGGATTRITSKLPRMNLSHVTFSIGDSTSGTDSKRRRVKKKRSKRRSRRLRRATLSNLEESCNSIAQSLRSKVAN